MGDAVSKCVRVWKVRDAVSKCVCAGEGGRECVMR